MKILIGILVALCTLNLIGLITLKRWSECVDDELEVHENVLSALSSDLQKEADRRRRGLLTGENKMNDLDERLKILQCRLNQERMQDIIKGKIID